MRPVARISIDYAKLSDFQSTVGVTGPRDLKVVNPLTIARYTLRNRDKAGFGIDDPQYLSYEGGFITEDDKLNIKYSDFEIKNVNTTGGNFSALGVSTFYSNIDINQKLVQNLKTLDTPENLVAPRTDNNPLTIKDFKDFNFYPGQIVAWNGSWDTLRTELPNWRLCAPPDAGKFINNVRVPNLVSEFVIGAQPSDLKDAGATYGENQPFTGESGGTDAVWLNEQQMPRHTHTVDLTAFDQKATLTGPTTFIYDGGDPARTSSSARACAHKGISCCCRYKNYVWKQCWVFIWRTFCRMQSRCDNQCNSSSYINAAGVTSSVYNNFSSTAYVRRRLEYDSDGIQIDSQSELDIGGSEAHENRPDYYTLAYIIYVGVPR